MTVANASITHYVGEDVSITETIYADAAKTTPENITGWAISFVVHSLLYSTAIITKTVGNGITLTDPTNGVLTITIASADTASLLPGLYVFKVLRTDTGADSVLTVGNYNLLGA